MTAFHSFYSHPYIHSIIFQGSNTLHSATASDLSSYERHWFNACRNFSSSAGDNVTDEMSGSDTTPSSSSTATIKRYLSTEVAPAAAVDRVLSHLGVGVTPDTPTISKDTFFQALHLLYAAIRCAQDAVFDSDELWDDDKTEGEVGNSQEKQHEWVIGTVAAALRGGGDDSGYDDEQLFSKTTTTTPSSHQKPGSSIGTTTISNNNNNTEKKTALVQATPTKPDSKSDSPGGSTGAVSIGEFIPAATSVMNEGQEGEFEWKAFEEAFSSLNTDNAGDHTINIQEEDKEEQIRSRSFQQRQPPSWSRHQVHQLSLADASARLSQCSAPLQPTSHCSKHGDGGSSVTVAEGELNQPGDTDSSSSSDDEEEADDEEDGSSTTTATTISTSSSSRINTKSSKRSWLPTWNTLKRKTNGGFDKLDGSSLFFSSLHTNQFSVTTTKPTTTTTTDTTIATAPINPKLERAAWEAEAGSGRTFLALSLCSVVAVAHKKTIRLDRPLVTLSLRDHNGRLLELPQDSHPGIYSQEKGSIDFGNQILQLKTPLAGMSPGSILFVELKQWKKRRFSTVAWSFVEVEMMVDAGVLCSRVRCGEMVLPLFRKPVDVGLVKMKRWNGAGSGIQIDVRGV